MYTEERYTDQCSHIKWVTYSFYSEAKVGLVYYIIGLGYIYDLFSIDPSLQIYINMCKGRIRHMQPRRQTKLCDFKGLILLPSKNGAFREKVHFVLRHSDDRSTFSQ